LAPGAGDRTGFLRTGVRPHARRRGPGPGAGGRRLMRQGLLGLLCLGLSFTALASSAPHITVQVDGLSGPLLKNVLAYLSVVTYQNAPDLTESLVEHLHARAPDEIQRALQPYGYYDAQVDGTLTPTADGWSVHYTVTLPP